MRKHKPKFCVCKHTVGRHRPSCVDCPCVAFEPINEVEDLDRATEEDLGITSDDDYFQC
jgi:hypothetical protein